MDLLDTSWVFYAAVIGVALIGADAFYLTIHHSTDHRRRINRRLARLDGVTGREQASIQLKRERGLDASGVHVMSLAWLNTLVVQSGLTWGVRKIMMAAALGAACCAVVALPYHRLVEAPLAALFGGVVAPILALMFLRRRRRKKFTDQLAEAIDMIVRSLRAGHPVPSAIRMVARSMPDPLGSEFGLLEDEVTFGLDLETAMRNLYARVGQDDLPLFVTSVAIQTQAGGNLTEILENLSGVIRQRVKMRRKIRALSAEGRFSAIVLTAIPVIVFLGINWLSPSYFGKHWHDPWMMRGLAGCAIWAVIGNLVMLKMINFKN
ncbi:MAG: type II secretion system F family protein [Methylobacteriaceae bacterium]|nr:type II secretion system F family protein [Methylobacteriaceae bacterium]